MGLMATKLEKPIHNKVNMLDITGTHSLRCDSKQFDIRFSEIVRMSRREDVFYLGELLPQPLIKGGQPSYIDGSDGIPVINTLSIQHLAINTSDCRYITEDDFDNIPDIRKLRKGDVLLTMDGGSSIGKSAVFELDSDYTVDSHVAILRPSGISPKALSYLLASPIGQLQFKKAESGASGQTSVTEEDLRRFVFPRNLLTHIEDLVDQLDATRKDINLRKKQLEDEETLAWSKFLSDCFQ